MTGRSQITTCPVASQIRRRPEFYPGPRARDFSALRPVRRVEALLAADGRTPDDSDLAEMDRLWDRAKAEERAPE